jgi:hypothetical protein
MAQEYKPGQIVPSRVSTQSRTTDALTRPIGR